MSALKGKADIGACPYNVRSRPSSEPPTVRRLEYDFPRHGARRQKSATYDFLSCVRPPTGHANDISARLAGTVDLLAASASSLCKSWVSGSRTRHAGLRTL